MAPKPASIPPPPDGWEVCICAGAGGGGARAAGAGAALAGAGAALRDYNFSCRSEVII